MTMEKKAWQKILRYLKIRDKARTDILEDILPQDIAEKITELEPEEQRKVFGLLNDEEAALILGELEPSEQAHIISAMDDKKSAAILHHMPSDDIADLLGGLENPKVQSILKHMHKEDVAEVTGLLKYPTDSAGGLMTTEFIAFKETTKVKQALSRLRELAPSAETVYYLYTVDEDDRLVGVTSLRELIASSDEETLGQIMRTNVLSVNAEIDQEEVANIVQKYDLLALPVVDNDEKLLGIVTVDDIMDVIEEETTEDIYHLVGTSEREGKSLVHAGVLATSKARLPWLIVCLLGGLISGFVIDSYEDTLANVIALASFIPVIMDMGGNVGSQSSTVFVRGVATGEILPKDMFQYFFKDMKVGLIMGSVCGVSVAGAAALWQANPMLGLVVGLAMFCTVALAATIGTLIPIFFIKLGVDPAVTAGPFVTTIKDVTGLMIYFYIAMTFMEYL
ncbi:magnesium transporter [Proteinivorax hydrogeniformans]|uniref:Magnesium transporter MgtE n=1 Tax=Proteinivorax hydrogeniformans TaxID=1826727 RepID=A0AAU8HWV6_9FIRM